MFLADILIWPTVGESDYAWLVFFILFMVAAFFIINLLFRKQKLEKESRGFAYSEVVDRNFSPDESKILKKFIDQLPNEARQILAGTRSWKFLRKQLHDYLLNNSQVTPEIAVRIYDRLFIEGSLDHSFNVNDLNAGEIAALITERGEELTRIVKNTEEDLLLSSPNSLLDIGSKNIQGRVYVFRPRQGGFFIPGVVIGCMKEAVLFHITGAPEHAGHAHLMIQEKFQVEITNWPKFEELQDDTENVFSHITKNEENEVREDMKSLEEEIRKRFRVESKKQSSKPQTNLRSEKEKNLEKLQKNQNIEFFCLSLKLSDRGLLFELPEELDPEFWKKSDLWEAKFQMPGGRYVITKGKIFPASGSKSRFIFKFVDMEESERILIYEDIKKFGGEREVLR